MKKTCCILILVIAIFFIFNLKNAQASKLEWHKVVFHISWEHDNAPMTYIDTLIGAEIIAPILEKYQSQIDIFFLERKCERKNFGHIFTFYFFSKRKNAKKIFEEVFDDLIIKKLERKKIITKIRYRGTGKTQTNALSNPAWDRYARQSWPYQMQGISGGWITSILEINKDFDKYNEGKRNLLVCYQEIENQLKKSWYLHQRDAIFNSAEQLFDSTPGRHYHHNYSHHN